MLIAFWGAGVRCGTSLNMLAVKEQLKASCPMDMERLGISFVDCGHRKDTNTREVLKRADLVVVNLKQEKNILDRFFLYDIHIAGSVDKLFFLIGSYRSGTVYGRKQIMRNYRMDAGRFGVIPCNSEFEQAAGSGTIIPFIKEGKKQPLRECNRYFFREIQHVANLLVCMLSDFAG